MPDHRSTTTNTMNPPLITPSRPKRGKKLYVSRRYARAVEIGMMALHPVSKRLSNGNAAEISQRYGVGVGYL